MNDKSREALKDDRVRQMQISAAEAVIGQALKDGVNVRAVYADERIELEFTQGSGKKIMIYVRYEDFSTGGFSIVSLVQDLDKQ